MTIGEFFWLDDAKFAAHLKTLSDEQLLFDDIHNVRKRKGGKLGAWVGTAQLPFTLGISIVGVGIGARNREVAKRRLEMIHTEMRQRGLTHHVENWKDDAFAAFTVGAGVTIGMGFVPGCEIAAQEFAEAGAVNAATYLSGVAVGEVSHHVGEQVTEITSSELAGRRHTHQNVQQ